MRMKTITLKDGEDYVILKEGESNLVVNDTQADLLLSLVADELTELDGYLGRHSEPGDDELWVRLGQLRILKSVIERHIGS